MLAVLDSVQRSKGVSGAVAEIGVHHGRLFIGLNLLRRDTERAVAIDVFGEQELNTDMSGKGDLSIFLRNVRRWSTTDGVAIHQGDSTQLTAAQLGEAAGGAIRLFSVDGGHTESTVLNDMKLAESTLAPGGVVIADDVFNEQWPGVSTGTLRYMAEGGLLVPFAIGFNKVFFCSPNYAAAYRDSLHRRFDKRYLVFVKLSEFALHEVLIIARVPRRPRSLVARNQTARALYRHMKAVLPTRG
ncbi:MAG: class I SAM-dependent methyltransferase [Actinomycetota bacterium]